MKRMIALFLMLTLVMLLMPTGVTASEKFAKKPYYLVNSSAVNVETGYAYDMPYFWGHPYPEGETKATVSAFHRTEPPYITISDYPRLTTMLKKEFEDRPEGTRYINFDLSSKAVYHLAEDYIYFGVATKSVYDWIEPFLAEYKRIGGTLDGVILDIEYIYGYNYYICTREYEQGNKDIYWEIVNHPQYKTLVRPMLVERGFRFWPESQQDSEKSEIWTMYARHGAEYAMERAIWDNVVDELLKKYANESVYEPLMKYFPDATLNDYDRRDSYGWQKALQYTFDPIIGNESKVGNVSNYNAYSYRPFKEGIGSYTTPASFNDVKFEATPFNIMMYEFFQCKTMYEPTDTKTISMWITFFNYSPNYPGTYSNTPYYAESIYHMGMMDPQPFLGYIVPEEVRDMGQYSDDPKVSSHDYCIEVVSELMAELTRVAGYADRKHIPTPINWNNDFLLTGMYAGGRNIWRITPDISKGVSLEKFKVKDKAPTFSIGGQTVIFPQGRIIEDSEISQVGTCGYWVETPADVTPVIIADTDRYANYPSVADNFESYAVNQTFSTSSSDLWSVVGVGAKIEYYKGDKALALNGNITLRDKKAAPNVTAGDSYALQQIWEVSFTGHSSGELKLLSCSDQDGGIQAAGADVYYDHGGTYKKMPGVSLKPGVVYTARRQVDFRNKNGFTSTYTILDDKGNVLATVKDVPMVSVSLPVSAITISYKRERGDIYIDDYKLYPVGLNTDFEVYDAEYGYEVADISQARTKDTAYRLSWLNASDTYQVAKVYNNNTVVGEVKMAPGKDGVLTGVVKAKAGETIRLTVKTEDTTPETYPDYDKGDFEWKPGEKPAPLPGGNSGGGNTPSGDVQTPGSMTPSDTVKPTTPTTPVDGTDPTNPVDSTNPTDGIDTTNPADKPNDDSTRPSDNKPGTSLEKEDGPTGGMIVWIIIVSVTAVCGVFALLWFVIKPKWLTDFFKKPAPWAEEPTDAE